MKQTTELKSTCNAKMKDDKPKSITEGCSLLLKVDRITNQKNENHME